MGLKDRLDAEGKGTRGIDPSDKYERRDLDLKSIAVFVAVLLAGLVLTHFIVLGTFRFFLYIEPKPETQSFTSPPAVGPAGAGLLVNAPRRMADIRAQEDEILNNYGWMDPSRGVVRLPIEHAMDLVVERGLPAKIGGTPPEAGRGR
jgi:hypothetical protein